MTAYNCITTIIKVLIIYSGNLKLILLLPSLFLMNETISPRSRKSWVFDTKLIDLQLLFSNCNWKLPTILLDTYKMFHVKCCLTVASLFNINFQMGTIFHGS